jgi:hypothetical protein
MRARPSDRVNGLARPFGGLCQARLQRCAIGIIALVAAALEFGTKVKLIEVARVSIGLAPQFDSWLRATILREWSL